MAVQGKSLWGHFDGTQAHPVLTTPKITVYSPPGKSTSGSLSSSAAAAQSSSATPTIVLGTATELRKWDHQESIAKSLLAQ
jgi:hypothetical protein